MKIITKELTTELLEKTKMNLHKAEGFKELSGHELNYKENNDERIVFSDFVNNKRI